MPPGPHFVIRLISMAHFRSKNIFCKPSVKNRQKVLWKSAPLITICIFQRKKNFAKFLKFLRFSQIQLPGGKICDWYIILYYFAKHLTPMLNLGPRSCRNGKFKSQNSSCDLFKPVGLHSIFWFWKSGSFTTLTAIVKLQVLTCLD